MHKVELYRAVGQLLRVVQVALGSYSTANRLWEGPRDPSGLLARKSSGMDALMPHSSQSLGGW